MSEVTEKCAVLVFRNLTVRQSSTGYKAMKALTMIYLLQHHLYLPVLFFAAIITAAGVIWWSVNNSDIDPGQPNARIAA